MKKLFVSLILVLSVCPVWASPWMIGDNDGYGMGIPDDADHPFAGFNVTTPPGLSSQPGIKATLEFTGLGDGWTKSSIWFDSVDFQASTFVAVNEIINRNVENGTAGDGIPNTMARFLNLNRDLMDSIILHDSLTVIIDRYASTGFHDFNYALLSDHQGANAGFPESVTLLLFGTGMAGIATIGRKWKI